MLDPSLKILLVCLYQRYNDTVHACFMHNWQYKAGVGGIFSFFVPFLFRIISPESLGLEYIQPFCVA